MDSSDLASGTVVAGKYRIERVLGRGGMGVVFAARHLELDQRVAIKLLLPEAMRNPEAVERFLREGRASARLCTPHVAKVHDVGRLETGEHFLVMELLRGRDLKAVIEEAGAQPLSVVVHWVLEAGEALTEAHALGVVHRDVKPANLFLTELPNGRTMIKVLDFGISKQLDTGAADLTRTSSMMGSPLYMAPEQVMSMRHVDPRVDVWALGVVLYELATGRTPFTGTALTEVIGQIMTRDPLPPSALRADLPVAFDRIVMMCLRKDPELRYADVAALDRALRELDTTGYGATQLLPPRTQPRVVAAATSPFPVSGFDFRPSRIPALVDPTPAVAPLAPEPRPSSPSLAALGGTQQGWGNTGKAARGEPKAKPVLIAYAAAAGAALLSIGIGVAVAIGGATRAPGAPPLDASPTFGVSPSVVPASEASASPVASASSGTVVDLGDLPNVTSSATKPGHAGEPTPRGVPSAIKSARPQAPTHRSAPSSEAPPEPPKKPTMF